MSVSRIACVSVAALPALSSAALAQPAPTSLGPPSAAPAGVAFSADQVRIDARSQSLDVSGHVRVDEPPFHLTSDSLMLRRVSIGAELDGNGKLAFCPCLGTPLAVRFSEATVAPPYDVILREPVLEVFGVPVAWAPAIWLRSPARAGLLPPELAWRGADGFFAGGGVHMPWQAGDAEHGIDVRAGGYVEGGVAVESTLVTTATRTRLGWDRFHGDDGVSVDARGSSAIADDASVRDGAAVAWQLAALRGTRAVQATPNVDEAARPFDRGQGEVVWRFSGWTLSSRVETVAVRGGELSDFGESGPVLVVRRSDALGTQGEYDVTLEGGQLSGANTGATSFARTEANAGWTARCGAVQGSLAVHGFGQMGDAIRRGDANGAAQSRMVLGLPLARSFESADPHDPWVHTTEPRVELAAVATRTADALVVPAGPGMAAPSGVAWIAAGGWANAIGRWGSRAAASVDATAGAIGNARQALPVLRARAAASGPWVSLRAELARASGVNSAGGAFFAQARLGSRVGLHVGAHVAESDGVDPIVARALADPTLEPASGFLTTHGWTGGGRLSLPLGSRVTARAGADVDFNARMLVAALGSIELHDPCNCVVVRANGSERIGRDGIDIWVSVDLPMDLQ